MVITCPVYRSARLAYSGRALPGNAGLRCATMGTLHMDDLLDRMRATTRARHAHLESRLGSHERPWTRAKYARLLRISYAVIAPVEDLVVDRLGVLVAAPPPATRAERLRADLTELGHDPRTRTGPRRPQVESEADAFGVGYVLQGSLLGGAVIARQIRSDCAGPEIPTRYLELYGPELPKVWARYCAALNEFGRAAAEAERQGVVAAASATFEAFGAALDSGP
jgi:heme oxygenase